MIYNNCQLLIENSAILGKSNYFFAGNKLNDLKVSIRVYSYMFSKHLNECRVLSVECILQIICWTSFLFGFYYMLTSYLCFQTSFFISFINQITVQIEHITFIHQVIMISTFLCLFVLRFTNLHITWKTNSQE